jgi:hypothetical protein
MVSGVLNQEGLPSVASDDACVGGPIEDDGPCLFIGVPFGRGTIIDHIPSSLFIDNVSCSTIYCSLFLDSCSSSFVLDSLFHGSCSTRPHSTSPQFHTSDLYIPSKDSPTPTLKLSHLLKSQLPHLPQSDMFFPPPIKVKLFKLPLENIEELALERLSWITGYDTEKHVSMFHVFTDLQANLGV